MTRQTSIDVFKKISEGKLLSKKRFLVYSLLFEHGPATQRELFEIYLSKNPSATRATLAAFTPRFIELEKRNAVVITGERPCKITGHTCIEWDVTDSIPVEPEKRKSTKQLLDAALVEIDKLRARLELDSSKNQMVLGLSGPMAETSSDDELVEQMAVELVSRYRNSNDSLSKVAVAIIREALMAYDAKHGKEEAQPACEHAG